MPRPKEFDPDIALEKAMKLFWEKGYKASSMTDLVEHTGVHRGSLYETFGNKHDIFLAALKKYGECKEEELKFLEDAESPLAALRMFFVGAKERIKSGEMACGCMAVNSATEIFGDDKSAHLIINFIMEKAEGVLYKALLKAREKGELNPKKDPRKLSHYIATLMTGLMVLVKTNPHHERIDNVIDHILDELK